MVEGARLESVYTPKGYRGFESRPLRINSPKFQHEERWRVFLFQVIIVSQSFRAWWKSIFPETETLDLFLPAQTKMNS